MKLFSILLLLFTLSITTLALPNFIPEFKEGGSDWTLSHNGHDDHSPEPFQDNSLKPVHNPVPVWNPHPPKPVNPWKPAPPSPPHNPEPIHWPGPPHNPEPPHYPEPTTTHKPTLSWGNSRTSTLVHLPTHSVGHQPWKRDEHFEPKPYHGGGGKLQSVTRNPWQPPKPSSTSPSPVTSSPTTTNHHIPEPTSWPEQPGKGNGGGWSPKPPSVPEQPGKGNGEGWNPQPISWPEQPSRGSGEGWEPPQGPPDHNGGWPSPARPELGNGWHIAEPHNGGFGEHGRAINSWERDDVLEA